MRSSGIDIGSRTVKLAVLEDGEIVLSRKAPVTHDPLEAVCRLIEDVDLGVITATGYGRHLVRKRLNSSVISEIKAFALGARKFSLDCRTILDIGGQDTKVIALDEKGDMSTFEMNDKCAAGTGRFLEIMAVALGYNLEEFSTAALSAGNAARINSTCAVFAESEVISLTYQGTPREEVALGIHKAIISRCSSMLKRIVAPGPILLAGGVALNECVRVLIGKEMNRGVFIPADPQMVGAVGAALHSSSILNECGPNRDVGSAAITQRRLRTNEVKTGSAYSR